MSASPSSCDSSDPAPPAAATAGLLLAARTMLARLGLAHPSVAEILDATGSGATAAYARRARLQSLLAACERAPGRPRHEAAAPADVGQISHELTRFLMQHPGAVHRAAHRRRYSDSFRQFVLGLRGRYRAIPEAAFARAVHVPLTTLRWWQRAGRDSARSAPFLAATPAHDTPPGSARPAAMIIDAWRDWHGSFGSFCAHVERVLGIPWKRTRIGHLLSSQGLRQTRPRPGRDSGARASRKAFSTFFPGAQWVADGTSLCVGINGQSFRCNLELVVDTASGAIIGTSVRDREDGQAVLAAYRDAVGTTQAPPLALLLDHHPCNKSEQLRREIQPATRIHAARGRPQSKAHVEGAFGLFAQTAPALDIQADSPRALAHAVLELVVQCWARTLNHRPRRDRRRRSRVELYRCGQATPHEHDAARAALRDRAARARCGRRSREPAMRSYVAAELARMGIPDADGHIASKLLRYPLDALFAGIATYAGKRAAGRLPVTADARYLLGIVRRIAEADEGDRISARLWQTRSAGRAHLRATLEERRRAIVSPAAPAEIAIARFIDEALAVEDRIEQRYWIAAAALVIRRAPERACVLYRRAARRIHWSPDLPYTRRLALARMLAAESIPLE